MSSKTTSNFGAYHLSYVLITGLCVIASVLCGCVDDTQIGK